MSSCKMDRIHREMGRSMNINQVANELSFEHKLQELALLKRSGLGYKERQAVSLLLAQGVSLNLAVHHVKWQREKSLKQVSKSENRAIKSRARGANDSRYDYVGVINTFVASGAQSMDVKCEPRKEGETRARAAFYHPNKCRFDTLIKEHRVPIKAKWRSATQTITLERLEK